MAEPKKTESKPSEHKHTEHKSGEHKEKPEAKSHHPTGKTTGPVKTSEKATGAAKKTEAAAAKSTEAKAPSKPAAKGDKAPDVKIVDQPTEKKHTARAKATLTDEQKKGLQQRRTIAGRRPWFRRQQWYEYKKLERSGWRKPTGVDSAMRRHFGYEQPVVRIGFAGPKSVRGLHASGFREVYVEHVDHLKAIDTKTEAARVSGTLGTRKLRRLYEEADKLGVRILNRRDLGAAPKASATPPKPAATTTKPTASAKGGEAQ